jgi:hypothetical protein
MVGASYIRDEVSSWPLNYLAPNRQVGLEMRTPVVVKKNHSGKREGESGAGLPFSSLLSQGLDEQRNDSQPSKR